MTNYIPLHLHTDKSLMDGVATPEEYGNRAVELGMRSVAVTDHGTMSSHRPFSAAMIERGIKPIFGVEAYITGDIQDRRDRKDRTAPLDTIYKHLTIIAKNEEGYRNLSQLNQISWTEGYFYKPRIDFSLLDKHKSGLILGSACMGGLINGAIELGETAIAKQHIATLRDIAGEDFYIELMPHNSAGINAALLGLANEFKVKTIVTPDCHHAHVGQKVIQEIMLIANTHPNAVTAEELAEQEAKLKAEGRMPDYECLDMYDAAAMRTFDTLYGPNRKMTFNKLDIHLLSGQEMWDGMGDDARQESFDNTFEIDEKVEHVVLATNLDLLPKTVENPRVELRERCIEFLDSYDKTGPEYLERLDEELAIIGEKNFDEYFLIIADIVSWAKDQGIIVGPGRGSGVSSLVNFCLGNTQVDPIEFGLLFFRFIDPSRMDWPDVDVDFEDRRRDEVKAYVANKYGHDKVASIATYQKFQNKGIIKDVARVFKIPLSDVNRVSKLVDTWEEFKTSTSTAWFRSKYPMVELYGDQLRGRTRGTGMHASGMVTSRVPLSDIAPMETRPPKNREDDRLPVVATDMDETADIGLIKLDILGLKALSTIKDTLRLIEDRTGRVIQLGSISKDDAGVYAMLSAGHTSAVFQCEQAPYTKLLVEMGIDSFNDLVATNALVRPGASKTIGKEYMARKSGKTRTSFIHKDTESFTAETRGLPVYQEQIMLLCTELAGMSMVDANKVRKITAKKKDPVLLEKYRAQFVSGAAVKIGVERAELLWEDLLKWADYGFNKSHAVAYSYISYWTAWLKYHYPLEFMTATLRNEGDGNSRTQYLIEAKRMGVKVLLPHISKSGVTFEIEGDAIRIGLSSIKFISDKIASRYVAKRPFSSYNEVKEFTFTKGSGVNSRAMSAMDAIGALNFDDNVVSPSTIKSNLYEYLNLPEMSAAVPTYWNAFMTTASEFSDQGAYVMMGIVTGIRRGKGWSLITVMDSTGSFGVFDKEESEIIKGRSYLFLVGDNRIVEAVPLDEVADNQSGMVKWLSLVEEPCASNELFIISFVPRTTKAGQRMGNIIASTSERELVSIVVFATQFPTAFVKLVPGTSHRIVCEEGRNGGLVFKRME